MSNTTYYQRNRDVILNRAKKKFFFSIYMKYLQVTNLLHLKYNKNTIIKTFYSTVPKINLRHIH